MASSGWCDDCLAVMLGGPRQIAGLMQDAPEIDASLDVGGRRKEVASARS